MIPKVATMPNGSFVSLPLPLTPQEIHRQLFEVITRFNFANGDDIYLYFTKNEKYNFRLFFHNYGFSDHSIFIGWYPYSKFIDKNPEECKKFAKEIFDEILKLREEAFKNPAQLRCKGIILPLLPSNVSKTNLKKEKTK